MRKPLIPSSADSLKKMGQSGRDRVLAEFSQTKMTQLFDHEINRVVASEEKRPVVVPGWLYALLWVLAIAIPGFVLALKLMGRAFGSDKGEAEEIVKIITKTVSSLAPGATVAYGEL